MATTEQKKTRPTTFRRALLIGLGGSGQKVLVQLKRFFIDECGSVPPCVKMLALDTSNNRDKVRSLKTGEEISLGSDEFQYLEVANPVEFINASDEVRSWFILEDAMPKGAIRAGTQAIRANGRLALYAHINDVRARLKNLFDDLFDASMRDKMEDLGFELFERHPEVCITGSLAGGTGSGTFIDMGVLAREETKDQNAIVTGIFLLPWIYRNCPATFRTPSNTYAALCEIDALQSENWAPENEKHYTVTYPDMGKVAVDEQPYTLFHLIDGRNEYGENIDHPDALARCIAEGIFLNLGAVGIQAGDHIDNILGATHVMKPWDEKKAKYTSLGVSSLVYPAEAYHEMESRKRAVELLDAAIQDCMTKGKVTEPPKEMLEAVRTFLMDSGLAQERMQELLSNILDLETMDTRFALDDSLALNDKRIVNAIESRKKFHMENINNQIEARMNQSAETRREEACVRLQNMIGKLRREEEAGRLQPNYTLFWIQGVLAHLNGVRKDILERISECNTQLEQIREGQEYQKGTIENAPHGLFRRQRRAACEKYADTVSEEAAVHARRERYQAVGRLLEAVVHIAEQAQDELRGEPGSAGEASRVLEGIKAEFLEKVELLRSEDRKRRANPFEIFVGDPDRIYIPNDAPLPTMSYEAFKADTGITSAGYYSGKTKEELAEKFLGFAKEKCEPILHAEIKDVMREVEKTRPDYMNRCMRDLLRLSSALWRYKRGYVTPQRASTMCNIIVCGAYDREDAATEYGERITEQGNLRYSPSWVSTGDPYRVVMLQYAVSIPAFALQDIPEYRRKYEEILSPTSHIDARFEFEAPDVCPEEAAANKALRIVTLGIIEGLDVIVDKKLDKGHSFTIDDDDLNDPGYQTVLPDFISLYDYVIENQEVREVLGQRVIEKCESMAPEELDKILEAHEKKLTERLNSREFTKLISARHFYREREIVKRLRAHVAHGDSIRDYIQAR